LQSVAEGTLGAYTRVYTKDWGTECGRMDLRVGLVG